MLDVDEYWNEMRSRYHLVPERTDFRFDLEYYAQHLPDVAEKISADPDYFSKKNPPLDWFSNNYKHTGSNNPALKERLKKLVIEPRLVAALREGQEEAFELAFELVLLGDPIDKHISDYSHAHYLKMNPDIEKSKINGFLHYINHGFTEGRVTLRDLRLNDFAGDQEFDRDKPTCFIGIHELSRTGAPLVGLQIVEEAVKTHNVIVGSLRPGQLIEQFRPLVHRLVITPNPEVDIEYLDLNIEFDYAVLNSVESIDFFKFLMRKHTPIAIYLHEFVEYMPPWKALMTSLLADVMVFSSSPALESWRPWLEQANVSIERDTAIIPQHDLEARNIGKQRYEDARSRLSEVVGIDCTSKRVVYGAGHVHWRKGCDIFVMTAQAVAKFDKDTVFIWIGDGENHEEPQFGVYYEKHLLEAKANTPDGNLFTVPAGDYYRDICRAADIMFLTSRFDPLPNVVFDATKFGCHVLMFENSSGFDDPLYRNQQRMHFVDFGDIGAAAEKLVDLPVKLLGKPGKFDDDHAEPKPVFNDIEKALKKHLRSKRDFVIGAGQFDVPILFSGHADNAGDRQTERSRLWSNGRRFVWKSTDEARETLKISESWFHKPLRVEDFKYREPSSLSPVPKFNMHVHAYYIDELEADVSQYAAYQKARRIVVTTNSRQKAQIIEQVFLNAGIDVEVRVEKNQGRDILPFLKLVDEDEEENVWCHIHQKRTSRSASDGEVWRKFVLAIILGDHERMSSAVDIVLDDDIGLVGPFDPLITGWSGCHRLIQQMNKRFDEELPEHPILFPVGNMFWTKTSTAVEMLSLFGRDYPWPNEPLPNDGTVYHMMERLWSAICAKMDRKAVFLSKPDQPRN